MNIPRNEYPRPQLERESWLNLNGEWDFEIDNCVSGIEKEFFKRPSLNQKIIVPFCPESELSGVNHKDFLNCVWYRKSFEIPKAWKGSDIILHFGAVDYHAMVYVNGEYVGEHKGGYTPFCFDITDYLKENGNYITLRAFDDIKSGNQPSGKQSKNLYSHDCFYTRTTGIWQTVWLEPVSKCHIKGLKMLSDTETPAINIELKMSSNSLGAKIKAEAFWNDKNVGVYETAVYSDSVNFAINLSEKHLWSIGKGNLYDLKITVEKDGKVCDSIKSYFGLRSVALNNNIFTLNGEKIFGRWVLDQGYYPDGIYTAPTDEALKNDILYSMELGFNGARLHEKIFEPRFLYWADKLGYAVWGEHANWGLDITRMEQIQYFLPEWLEGIERDFSHPSIIGWCPFNETWNKGIIPQCDEILRIVYNTTKAVDPSRPVIDTSGNFHVISDIFDVHDYEQDPEKFASYYENIDKGIINDQINRDPSLKVRQSYNGKDPVFISEYGGIKWACDAENGWGYGDAPKTEEEFLDRYEKLTGIILKNKYILGFCYTQLYDVEQEQNGLMTYDRKFKFDPSVIRKINTQKAAVE